MAKDNILDNMEESEEFKRWKKEHADSYLAHIFRMDSAGSEELCLIGYYNPDDTITSFEINGKDIVLKSCEKIFKQDSSAVKKLEMDKVSLDFKQIKSIAEEFRKKKYKNELPSKKIFILQNIDIGQVWNVTIVTLTFNTLNLKIDANTGEVIQHNLTSLMQMGKFTK